MKKTGTIAAAVAIVLAAGTLGWLYFAGWLDREKPLINLDSDITAIGVKKDIGITFSDARSGLSGLTVELIQDQKPHLLTVETFPSRSIRQKVLRLTVEPIALKLNNGPATLRITARDASLFKNETVVSEQVRIDTLPPQIYVMSPVNYINQGGTGFIPYRISKPAARTGVFVDDRFFPGYPVVIGGKPTSVAYFALGTGASAATKIVIFARDDAGNESRTSMPFTIKPKKFRADKVNLSDTFLQKIMPEFQAAIPQLQGKTAVEVFGYVNTTLREENAKTIQSVCGKSSNKKLWEGTFHRMRNASPMALFGDERTYLVDGKPFGHSVHFGVDLASTAHAPIEAANNGIVVFAGPLGIYGNTVIIDHGLGLFSLYGHLSSIETAVGKPVKKEEKIGLSGLSGLAGGDHLHFSIVVGGQFVNPQEWWDPHWIEDNVMKKMNL
ncbi:MAG TPA: M23 family metallopeptidase [Smithellaceae bacterium]|nr:M23 family metallopeptidase [Smithellaceae bacterium]